MVTVYYWAADGLEQIYRCRLSGRSRFDLGEAAYKCRWLVQRRFAERAEARDADEVIVAAWEWRSQEAVRLLGPEL